MTKHQKDNTSSLRVKTLSSIKIEVGRNGVSDTAYIEVAGLETVANPTISTKSSSTDFCNKLGDTFDTKSVSFRDAFTPGAKMYLTGIFENWISGELIYGEYEVLSHTFTRKEN